MRALLTGAVLICLLGVADDKWELDALTKLAGQVLVAGVLVLQGVQMLYLPVGGLGGGERRLAGAFVLGPAEGTVLTVLIVVATINAVNFVDGLDGLAAGIVGDRGHVVLRLLLPARHRRQPRPRDDVGHRRGRR